jgi:hypothetical protein
MNLSGTGSRPRQTAFSGRIGIFQVLIPALACLLLSAAAPGKGSAYVLDGRYVLELMLEHMALPAELQVVQSVTLFDSRFEGGRLAVTQRVSYKRPGRFRSEIRGSGLERIYVASNEESLTILDGRIVSQKSDILDRYKDLFCLRQRKELVDHLRYLGLDPAVESYGRNGKSVVYVIGAVYPAKRPPQLWVDKERFLPVRWLLPEASGAGGESRVAFHYEDWRRLDGGQYPGVIKVYHGGELIRKMEALSFAADPSLPAELFDIDYLKAAYAEQEKPVEETAEGDAVEQQIQQFTDIFESEESGQ